MLGSYAPRLPMPAGSRLLARLAAAWACTRRTTAYGQSREAGDSEPGPVPRCPGPAGLRSAMLLGRVLVLNASFEPINVCTVRRAAVLILKDRAEVLEHAE